MALLGKIREKSGLAVTIIAVGLLLFIVGSDLMQTNSFLMGKSNTVVGTIAGKDIDYKIYQEKLDEAKQNYAAQTGKAPTDYELQNINEQVWNQCELTRKQYDEKKRNEVALTAGWQAVREA